MLTLRGTALHDVEQLRYITLHSCGVGLVDYFPPAADLDGMFFFLCLSSSHLCLSTFFCRACLRSRSCSLMACANSLTMHGIITSTAHAYVRPYLPLSHFWVGAQLYDVVAVLTLYLGLYLTDVTFCREGNTSHRTSPLAADKKLINFSKYHKMARIVQGTVCVPF